MAHELKQSWRYTRGGGTTQHITQRFDSAPEGLAELLTAVTEAQARMAAEIVELKNDISSLRETLLVEFQNPTFREMPRGAA